MKPDHSEIYQEFETMMDEMTLDQGEVREFSVEFVSGNKYASKTLLNHAKEAMNEGFFDLAKDGHIASVLYGDYKVEAHGNAFKHKWTIHARVIINHYVPEWNKDGDETAGKITIKKQKRLENKHG